MIQPSEMKFVLAACDLHPSYMEIEELKRQLGDEHGWVSNEDIIPWIYRAGGGVT